MEHYQFKATTINQVLDYLSGRPYKEVHFLVESLMRESREWETQQKSTAPALQLLTPDDSAK